MIKSFKKLWLQYLFRGNGIVPASRLLVAVAAGTIPALLGNVWGAGWQIFFAYNGFLVMLSVVDLMRLPGRGRMEADRKLSELVEQSAKFEVMVILHNRGKIPVFLQMEDDLPVSFFCDRTVFACWHRVAAGEKIKLSYQAIARERGDYNLKFLYIRYRSVMGLWCKQWVVECNQSVKVYPDLSQLRAKLALMDSQFYIVGSKPVKQYRDGTDFAHMRVYHPDDEPRSINWMGTARKGELITNVYRPEQGQHVVILLDCGRIMGVSLGNRNRLEHFLEAALVLAAVVLKNGDYVSLIAFSERVKVHIPPGKGISHLHTIIEAVYNLQSDEAESDYLLSLRYMVKHQKKRGLIVLLSDMELAMFHRKFLAYLLYITKRHLGLFVSLQDPLQVEMCDMRLVQDNDAYVQSIAQKFYFERLTMQHQMVQKGIKMVDSPPGKLVTDVINAYMRIKHRGEL